MKKLVLVFLIIFLIFILSCNYTPSFDSSNECSDEIKEIIPERLILRGGGTFFPKSNLEVPTYKLEGSGLEPKWKDGILMTGNLQCWQGYEVGENINYIYCNSFGFGYYKENPLIDGIIQKPTKYGVIFTLDSRDKIKVEHKIYDDVYSYKIISSKCNK